MTSKHRRQIANQKRRQAKIDAWRDEAMRKEEEAAEAANNPDTQSDKEESEVNDHISKAKKFYRNHKKAILIGGGLVAAAALATAAVMAQKKSNQKNFNLGQLSGWGFAKAAREVAIEEIKAEEKGLAVTKVANKLHLAKMAKNDYRVDEDGTVRNLRTNRVLKPFKDVDDEAFVALVFNKNNKQTRRVSNLVADAYGDLATAVSDTEVTQ